MSENSFSPSGGVRNRGGYSGNETIRDAKTAEYEGPLVTEMISTIDKESVKELLKQAQAHPEIEYNFKQNGTFHILEKLSNRSLMEKDAHVKNIYRNLDIDRQFKFKDSKGNHYIKQANSAIDKTWTTRISSDELDNYPTLVSEESIKVAQESSPLISVPILNRDNQYLTLDKNANWDITGLNIKTSDNNIKIASKSPARGDFGVFVAYDKATPPVEISKAELINRNEKVAGFKLKDSNYNVYIKQAKVNTWDETTDEITKVASIEDIEDHIPNIGDYGFVVTKTGEAVGPFEVTRTRKILNQPSWNFEGSNGLKKFSFEVVSSGVEGFEEKDGGGYYISKEAKFIPVSGQEKISYSKDPEDALVKLYLSEGGNLKLAYIVEEAESPVIEEKDNVLRISKNANFIPLKNQLEKSAVYRHTHFVGKDEAGLYYLKGQEFDKYASNNHSVRDLNLTDAVWGMIHCGANKEDLRKVATLSNRELIPLTGNIKSPVSEKVIEKTAQEKFDEVSRDLKFVPKPLVKEASQFEDSLTVDAVLSLGLLKKHNIQEYLEVIPVYEHVSSELGKLLLTSRLGLNKTNSEVIKKALDSVLKVITALQTIKAQLKPVK